LNAYRPDIDGLRALAVVAVVAFHAGVPGCSGGFAGVDVFYVISGYLITTLLVDELMRTGSIDFAAFYARRVRRLLPALCVVVVATLALGVLLLHPFGERQELARSAIATALFSSNFFFWSNTGGYFDHDVTLRPLLHTWSLAVEEQFYLAWPPLLLLLHRAATLLRLPLRPVALASLVAIFAGSLLLTGDLRPTTAFYLLPARAWELALGALLGWRGPATARRAGTTVLAGLIGLGAAAATICLFDADSPWPGIRTLLPALATAALIASGAGPVSPAARLLALPPLVYVGRLSYSWYLWHWPLLAMLRAHNLGAEDPAGAAAAAGVSLALAALTYHFIENPVRQRRVRGFRSKRGALLAGAALLGVMLLAAAALGLEARDAAARRAAEHREYQAARGEFPPLTRHCAQDAPFAALPDEDACTLGAASDPLRLALWGDSHADQFGTSLASFARLQHVRVLQRVMRFCPPVAGYRPPMLGPDSGSCVAFNAAVLSELRALRARGLSGVVLSARWLLYAGEPALSVRRVPYANATLGPDAAAAMRRGLADTIGALHALGLRVLLIAPVPEMRYDVPDCLARSTLQPARCDVPRAPVDRNRREFARMLAELASADDAARVWDPLPELCDARTCYASRGGELLFHDDTHISAAAARALYPALAPALQWAAAGE